MGSVFVSWSGRCRDREVQRALVEHLGVLADLNAQRLREPVVPRPAFLEQLIAQRIPERKPIEPIRQFDEELSGRIVVDPGVSPDPLRLREDVVGRHLELADLAPDDGHTPEHDTLSLDVVPAGKCLIVPRMRVYGIDFELYDPRKLYPESNRVGFVFLDCPDLPSLDGCLVQVECRDQCRAYRSELLRGADWLLAPPSIHLRYLFEEWLDVLLGWVKYCFIPDLEFTRYEPLSGYPELCAALNHLPRDAAHERLLDALIESFHREVAHWDETVAGM